MSKEDDIRSGEEFPSLEIQPHEIFDRRPSDHRILFAPDPRERIRHDDLGILPLTRTFSRNSYSAASEHETERVKNVTSGKLADPATVLPIEYRTLSIGVSESISRHLAPTKGNVKNISELEWHVLPAQEAIRRLRSSETRGLDDEQAQRRLQDNGKNVLSPPPSNRIRKTIGYFFGGFGGMLSIAAIISIICYKPLGDPHPDSSNLALGTLLFVVICIQGFFNAWQDWSSSKIMASITQMIPAECLVLRDGQQRRVPAANLVVGDIISISLGNKCPADIRILHCSGDLKFDRSVLTGECEPIAGTTENTDPNFMESRNIGMQGTHVVSGNGIGLVIQTGDLTVFGRIAKLSSSERTGRTTLQKEILRFVIIIGTVSVTFASIVVIVWAAYLRKTHPEALSTTQLLITTISVLIAVIPEGLPVSVTLALTVIAKALGNSKVLCKSLSTVETLGAVNVLCSDKTGTLTQNKMFVQTASVLDEEFSTMEAQAAILKHQSPPSVGLEQLKLIAGLCNAAQFDAADNGLPVSQRRINGDATDAAILRFAEELGSVNNLHEGWKMVFDLPFNSKIKYMIRLFKVVPGEKNRSFVESALGSVEYTFDDDDMLLLIKGAPDILLPYCSSTLCPDGSTIPIDQDIRARISRLQENWSSHGQRVILLARKVIKKNSGEIPQGMGYEHALYGSMIQKVAETGLTYAGMIGIVDPPREEIPEVVRICRTAGIRFFMVTGDFPLTAISIARQCGIIRNERVDDVSDLARDLTTPIIEYNQENKNRICKSIALTGKDLPEMTDSQWHQLCQYEEIVFARTTPEQKLRIVKEFQKRNGIVAMTGDGVNDAPGLKAADIGIAMGSGSDVAMEASDMVLLESFSSIVVCIEYGRLVYDNLKKVIIYLLPAGTFCELWPILFPVFFGLPQPLSSIEMIIISMLTDCIASLSLIKEQPEADLLLRPPRRPAQDRLTNIKLMFQAYFIIGVPMLVCACSMSFRVFARAGIPFSSLWLSYGNIIVDGVPVDPVHYQNVLYYAQSTYFLTLVLTHYGTLFMIRTRRLSIVQHPPIGSKRSRNLYLFGAMSISIAMMLLFLLASFFQNVFHTRAVSVEYWFIPFGFATAFILWDETRKFLVRQFPKGPLAKIAW